MSSAQIKNKFFWGGRGASSKKISDEQKSEWGDTFYFFPFV